MRRARRRTGSAENGPRATEAARAVDEFQAELARLDRALGRAIRGSEPSRVGSRIVDLSPNWLGLADLGKLLDQLDRIRGSERVDEFGLDLEFEKMIGPVFVFLYRYWWCVEVHGIENVPAKGPALLVADCAGAPSALGVAMLKMALRLDHPEARELRPLVDELAFHAPFLAPLIGRIGGVRACAEDAARLLRRGELVGVFPDGSRSAKMRSPRRDRSQPRARAELITSALRTGAPILPVAIVGAAGIRPLLGAWGSAAALLELLDSRLRGRLSRLGLLGLSPLPSRWAIRFGKPVRPTRGRSSRRASNPALVDALVEDLCEALRTMLGETPREHGATPS
jgi:1-acyl-sn-glycerol-3-phosphate acyltransferase